MCLAKGIHNQDKDIKEIRNCFRPGLFAPMYATLVFIAPYLWLFIDIVEKRYDRLLMLAAFSGLGVSVITLAWAFYIVQLLRYKKGVRYYLKSPETYEW